MQVSLLRLPGPFIFYHLLISTLLRLSLSTISSFNQMLKINSMGIRQLLLTQQLNLPTKILLSLGGDDRITLDSKTGLNKYYCSTLPRAELIRRSSCTCSNIDIEDYKRVEAERLRMLSYIESGDVDVMLTACASSIQNRIKSILLSNSSACEVILFPSGSDAEYLPLITALIRNRNNQKVSKIPSAGAKIFNFVTGATEVGSGTPNAAEGRHFSKLAPGAYEVGMNELVEGIESSAVTLVQYKPRDEHGDVSFQEDKLISDVDEKLSIDPSGSSVAIVHVVLGSKTGLVYPSWETVNTLRLKHGDRVIIVVDACQLRCKFSYIKWLVDEGCICLVTGSKFFGAAPFCGAVLLPSALAQELETHLSEDEVVVPKGLCDYLCKFDVPITMPKLRAFLDKSSLDRAHSLLCNPGLLLRWFCSLDCLETYARLSKPLIPSDTHINSDLFIDPVAEFTRFWVRRVQEELNAHGNPYLRLVPVIEGIADDIHVGGVNSIVSFSIFISSDTNDTGLRFLDADECKRFYNLMTTPIDASKHFDDHDLLVSLKESVLLGQPVKLANNGLSVLRIALGADLVVNSLEKLFFIDDKGSAVPSFPGLNIETIHAVCEKALMEDRALIKKAFYLAKYWNILTSPDKTMQQTLSPIVKKLRVFDDTLQNVQNPSRSVSTSLDAISGVAQELSKTHTLPPVALLYDIDALTSAFQSVHSAFSCSSSIEKASFLHCFAMKSCPLPYIIHKAVQAGLGIETASLAELRQALRCGSPANRVVFDSPCKTVEELAEALRMGVHVNVNSLGELKKIAQVIAQFGPQPGSVGLRINPLVGVGKIAALSTSTSSSKFGIKYSRADSSQHSAILTLFRDHPFLTGIMCHVGSQGMSIDSMVEGVSTIVDLADEIDTYCGGKRINIIDIGGGLSVNYGSDEISPTFAEYSQELLHRCPRLFSSQIQVITEFGKSLIAKTGAILAKVEDVWMDSVQEGNEHATVICHTGADLLLRTAYCPSSFPHRVNALTPTGALKTGPGMLTTVHGPLCFSGDIISKNVLMAPIQPNDYVVVLDGGANTISLFSHHCSRQAPAVFAFSRNHLIDNVDYKIVCIKSSETIEKTLSFWD